jgi:coniferyl-aldehyde dehydrogenase
MTPIETLTSLFDRQRKAFAHNPCPTLVERSDRLDAISAGLLANRHKIHCALREDFSSHPNAQADFIEIFGVVARLQHAKSMLSKWMANNDRDLDSAFYGQSKAFVTPQPKGVIGNIVPWNFPFDIGIGPLAEMLAGGNSVIIKPSELAPSCSELMRDILLEVISEDIVAVVPGDIELAKVFPTLAWDHLMYTGNPEVARSIAVAAAKNLTPVTLELGGKCPALFTEDSVTRTQVSSVLRSKLVKNGQMCVAPDYALVPRHSIDDFIREARAYLCDPIANTNETRQTTGMINERHFERIESLVNDLKHHGTEIVELGAGDRSKRILPLRLAIDPGDDSAIMGDEIFGPILPVLPYDNLDEAIGYIARRERPLGIYVYTDDELLKSRILSDTHSGGVTFNACSFHAAIPNMGFGGSGLSGYGRHHGIEGFREFTNQRGVVNFDPSALALNIAPPYDDLADKLLLEIFGIE